MFHLQELRAKTGRTQEVTAELLGEHKTTYARWEQGVCEPSLDKAVNIALFYNVSLDYLTGLIKEPRPINKTE